MNKQKARPYLAALNRAQLPEIRRPRGLIPLAIPDQRGNPRYVPCVVI